MTGLIVRRLLQMPLILFVIYTITFALAWAIPGNPLQNPEGRQPPKEIIEAMKRSTAWIVPGTSIGTTSARRLE